MRVSAHSEQIGLDLSQHDEHYGFASFGDREIAEYETEDTKDTPKI